MCSDSLADVLFLTVPSAEYSKAILEFRQEFIDFGGGHDGMGSLIRLQSIEDWLAQIESCRREETCPSNWVPMTQYLCIRKTDGKMVGAVQIRHRFNEFLRNYGGHIGYSTAPTERRKGYATWMLANVLPKCLSLGIDPVLVCCLEGNEGSRRTILNNGGVYETTVYEPKENVNLQRYWISLSGTP